MDELWFAQNRERWFAVESLVFTADQDYTKLEKAWFAKGEKLSKEAMAEIVFDRFFEGKPLSN